MIAVKYTYDSSRNIESGEWAVVQGTPAASNPAVPSMPVTDGDIQAGDAEVYCPVFVINLDGINVTGVDIIPPMMDDMSTINKYLSELSSDFTKIKNYIVEEGSNSNGKYRKWSDGTLEMWFNSPFTCAIGTKAGSIYTSGQFTLNFPVASKTKCNIVLTIGAGGAIWGKVYGSANGYKSSFSYHLLSAVTWNVASFDLSYYARGTWK